MVRRSKPRAKHTKEHTRAPRLVSFAEAPHWLQDNHFLTDGYRLNYGFWTSLRSILSLHNESLNIWTHLLGFVLFIGLTYYTFSYKLPSGMKEALDEVTSKFPDLHLSEHIDEFALKLRTEINLKLSELPNLPELGDLRITNSEFWHSIIDWHAMEEKVDASILAVFPFLDSGNHTLSVAPVLGRLWAMHRDAGIHRTMFAIFLGGAMCCLFFSFMFHTFMCTSPRWCTILCRLDYASISVMIAASAIPAVFYGHYCSPFWQAVWLLLICGCCLIGVCVSMLDRFSTVEMRPFRAITFVAVGLSGVIPLSHQAYVQQGLFTEATAELTIKLIIMGALYILGAFLFATRIPERFFPGKFNIWFHSHQLHHICVVIAAYMHWTGLLSSYEYRMANPCEVL